MTVHRWRRPRCRGVVATAGAAVPVPEVLAVGEGSALGLAEEGQWICPVSVAIDLSAGRYPAAVVVDSYTPAEVVFGGASDVPADER